MVTNRPSYTQFLFYPRACVVFYITLLTLLFFFHLSLVSKCGWKYYNGDATAVAYRCTSRPGECSTKEKKGTQRVGLRITYLPDKNIIHVSSVIRQIMTMHAY